MKVNALIRNGLIRNGAMACLAISCAGHAAAPDANIELVAAGLEEHVGSANDSAALLICQGDAIEVLRKVDFSFSNAVKRVSLPAGVTYRLSFQSKEPDEQGATSCAASAQLQVAPEQSYRVAFTLLKQTCALSAGRMDAAGVYQEAVAAEGKMRRLSSARK